MFWHGGLNSLAVLILSTVTPPDDIVATQARVFDIAYAVNAEALPLDGVELWYTTDQGRTWHLHGRDEDRQSPVSFQASQEGLFGFFVRLINATGASSNAPTPSTMPHAWTYVDYTPPVLQMHAPRQTVHLGLRVLQIRWTAIDDHFSARPIRIRYRRTSEDSWTETADGPIANTGRFDWRLPENLIGSVSLQMTVRDRGGHIAESEIKTVEIESPVVTPVADGSNGGRALGGEDDAIVSKLAAQRAQRLMSEGRELRSRGDQRKAIARMREAVRFDPTQTDAFAEMATMLYGLGDLDSALRAFDIAINQVPTHRSALLGAAMVHRKRNDYAKSASLLRRVLRDQTNDAETWMYLGDVAVFQGDEILAREAYSNAATRDPEAAAIITRAQRRLQLMDEVSRIPQ